MKLKSLLLGLSAAALMGVSAHATVTLYIVGSTAFRPAATAAIIAYLAQNPGSGTANVVNGVCVTSDNPPTENDLFTSGNQIFTNADGSIVVKTSWTGSTAGLVDLAAGTADNFIPNTATTSSISIYPINNTDSTGASNSFGSNIVKGSYTAETDVPNLTFSDSYNTSVASALSGARGTAPGYSSLSLLQSAISAANYAGTSAGAGAQDAVGIIPFAWYAGNCSASASGTITPSDFKGVTQESISSLIGGITPLPFFTGNAAESSDYVALIGRNEDSGSRIAAFREAQQGFSPSDHQYAITLNNNQTTGTLTLSSGGSTINTGGVTYTSSTQTTSQATDASAAQFQSTAQLYTEKTLGWGTPGHSGYASGGDVTNVLLADNNQPDVMATSLGKTGNAYFIGYLGWADGYGLTNPVHGTSNGYQLTYNGVTPSVANIQNGTYSFWAFEHMYYLTTGSVGNLIGTNKTAADGIADLVFSTYACTNAFGTTASSSNQGITPPVAGILFSTVPLKRGTEGGIITHQ